MATIKHRKVSAKADGTDSTLVLPSDWNDEHDLVSVGSSVWLGRDATGPGDIQEFPVDHAATGDDFTMMTKAQVTAAIAAAIAGFDIPLTGDLCATLAAAKPNWILANGQTIGNVGSGAIFSNPAAEDLFALLWAINGSTWPLLDSTGAPVTRGSDATTDWTGLRKIALPDARGASITMVDLGSGVNALVALLGVKVGTATKSLTIPNLPSHVHGNAGSTTVLGGSGGGTPIFGSSGSGNTDATGGDPAATPPFSVPVPFDVTSPTIGANIFIKL